MIIQRRRVKINLFAISDLHLSLSADKPMDIFKGWENYTDRIKANWNRLVKEEDTVVIPGDISWALKIEDAQRDFDFINSLKGEKIILKGNHDLWWSTVKKINEFLNKNNFNTIKVLHNNFYSFGNFAICGTRGWLYDGTGENDTKILKRECGRLEKSLSLAEESGYTPIVFLHYPPAYRNFSSDEIIEVLNRHKIKEVYYGHIHGNGNNYALSEFGDIKMKLVSCDTTDFTPTFIRKHQK